MQNEKDRHLKSRTGSKPKKRRKRPDERRLAEKLWSVLDQRDKAKQNLDRFPWLSATHPVGVLEEYQRLRQYYERTFPKERRIREQLAQLEPVPSSDKKPTRLSPLQQQVARYLRKHHKAKAIEVCAWFDEKDIEGEKGWYQDTGKERELWRVYRNYPVIRRRINTFVSKVRRILKQGKLPNLPKSY